MDNQVRYTVTATDLLSGKLQGMQARAQGLEGTLAGVSSTAKTMGSSLMSGLGMLGIGFGIFKGVEAIKDSIEAVEKLHQAQAQVKAGLESTGYVAGVTAESLDNMAKSFSKSTKYSRADITDLQSLMLTFPAITKDTFPQATQAILDMSTRLGQDAKSSAIQLGKALQDPIRGITALRRVGVNFNDAQKDVIANLVATGQTAKAQTLILSELTTEFGGSAKAAFDVDPIAKWNKGLGSLKMALGEAVDSLREKMKPALDFVADGFKGFIERIKASDLGEKFEKFFDKVQSAVARVFNALKQFNIKGGGVFDAIISGIGFLLDYFGFLYEVMSKVIAGIIDVFHTIYVFLEKIGVIWLVVKVFDIVWGLLKLIGKGLMWIYENIIKPVVDAISWAYDKVKSLLGIKDHTVKVTVKKEDLSGVGKFKQSGAKGATTSSGAKAKGVKDVTGQKNVTINISIGNLINDFQIKTTNIQESTKAIHDKVVMALTGAVNDSQLIAGN